MEDTSENKPDRHKKHICAALLAHVDAGKTTLSEGLLYSCGMIRKQGRVDHKDAFLDHFAMERERGITIFSKQARIVYKNTEFVLLDTPGHVDFSAEMERTLQVLDYAVLVISGPDGVQGHTETLWKLLKKYEIPVFLFVNKMDLPGVDKEKIMMELSEVFQGNFVDFSHEMTDQWFENISLCDETLLETYLEKGTLKVPEDIQGIIGERKIFPCYFGSALRLEGVRELAEGLAAYTCSPDYGQEFGARVYKISRDDAGNRLTHMKITGGQLQVRQRITQDEKINQIRLYSGDGYSSTDVVCAGDVCAVTGLQSTWPGQGLGREMDFEGGQLEPVLDVMVQFPEGTNLVQALRDMRQLEEEDPKLYVVWNEKQQQIYVRPMGLVQLEVLQQILKERFGFHVQFGEGSVLYRETIGNTVEGVGHFEPIRHYAEVHLKMEPLSLGSGLVFDTDCSEEQLAVNWQRLVLTHLQEKEHIGVLTGSPITDMKITLIGGRAHIKHTEGGDFRQAVYRAVRQGLMQAESVLLEPYYQFSMEIPTDSVGRGMTDIKRMQGKFEMGEGRDGMSLLTGTCPVATMKEYPVEFASYTRGRGTLNCSFGGYQPCHNESQVIEMLDYHWETDVENTPDSVFCAHGAGFVVKWSDVYEHMHVERKIKSDTKSDTKSDGIADVSAHAYEPTREPVVMSRGVDTQRDYMAEDHELLAIFERTFGPVKRRTASDARHVIRGNSELKKVTIKESVPVEEYLLVDGYNIIFDWDELRALSEVNLDAARMRLMDLLCNYQGYTKCHLILVFDAYKVKGNPGSVENYHNISVVYTKEAETADMYIEKTTKRIGKKHRVRVATSDALEQMIILGHGATRISARAFREEMERINAAIRLFLEERGSGND